jgi:hypothetical protein
VNGWYLVIAGVAVAAGIVVIELGRRGDSQRQPVPGLAKLWLVIVLIAAAAFGIIWLATQ